MTDVIEIEVGNDQNDNLLFSPIQRRVRGRFDYLRVNDPLARMFLDRFPRGIPGQRLRLNLKSKEGQLIEPLHEPANATTAAEAKQRGRLPDNETFADADVPTWLFWMFRAVQGGLAKVTQGTFPDPLPGKPKLNFVSNETPRDNANVEAALTAQTAAFNRMADALVALLAKK